MLSEQNRLKHKRDFLTVYKEGVSVKGGLVVIRFWRIEPEKFPRREYEKDDLKIGFVISKKIHKSAVKRNRIKRKMREVIRLLLMNKKIKNGYYVSIIALSKILEKDFGDIQDDIVACLKKADILA